MYNVAVVTNIVPRYRASFYLHLVEKLGPRLTVFCQRSIPGVSLENAADQIADNIHYVSAKVAKGERFGWQFLPLSMLRRYDVVFVYGNPRLLSNVWYSLRLKLIGIPVVIWGQAHTANSNSATEWLRLLWWRCFNYIFTYTDAEAEQLSRRGFIGKALHGMNNGLDQKRIDSVKRSWQGSRLIEWQRDVNIKSSPRLLSCARLIDKNRFDLVMQALAVLKKRGVDCNWYVIGDGQARTKLCKLAEQLGITSSVHWLGAIYEEDELAPWFMSSDIFVHPSAIGLSLLHAMGYELPVITHDNPYHQMPEYVAFEDKVTGLSFQEDNHFDLANKIQSLCDEPEIRQNMGEAAVKITRSRFNVDQMAAAFLNIADRAHGRRSAHAANTAYRVKQP